MSVSVLMTARLLQIDAVGIFIGNRDLQELFTLLLD
jgi:hypothetical protein